MSSSSISPATLPAERHGTIDDEYSATAERYHGRFCSAALRILRNQDEAEDVVQQAYLRSLTNLSRFERRAALSTWIMRIVINEAVTRLRRRVPSVVLEMDALEAPNASPEEQAAERQVRELILGAVERLPKSSGAAFFVREVCENSAAETSAYFGISDSCMKARLHRAKALLRRELGAQLGIEGDSRERPVRARKSRSASRRLSG